MSEGEGEGYGISKSATGKPDLARNMSKITRHSAAVVAFEKSRCIAITSSLDSWDDGGVCTTSAAGLILSLLDVGSSGTDLDMAGRCVFSGLELTPIVIGTEAGLTIAMSPFEMWSA